MVALADRDCPEDPSEWLDSHMFYIALGQLVKEGLIPQWVADSIDYEASIPDDQIIQEGSDEKLIGWIMAEARLPNTGEWLRMNDPNYERIIPRLESLMEKDVFIEFPDEA